MTARVRRVALLGAALLLSSCGTGGGRPAGDGALDGSASAPPREVRVFAAASLHGVLEDLAQHLEDTRPGLTVTTSFGGSSDVVAQVVAGAPADVLVTADAATMARAVDAGVVAGDPVVVAENSLALVVPAGNPAGIAGLDASLEGTALVVCAPQVPCGALAAELATRARVRLDPVSEELSVTDVLAKVTSGQADAGLVYITDARRAGDAVEVIEVAGAEALTTEYLAAVTADSSEPQLAAEVVAALTGPVGRRLLDAAGFG